MATEPDMPWSINRFDSAFSKIDANCPSLTDRLTIASAYFHRGCSLGTWCCAHIDSWCHDDVVHLTVLCLRTSWSLVAVFSSVNDIKPRICLSSQPRICCLCTLLIKLEKSNQGLQHICRQTTDTEMWNLAVCWNKSPSVGFQVKPLRKLNYRMSVNEIR